MEFNGRFVLSFIDFAVRQGADFNKLLAIANYTVDQLTESSCKVESVNYFSIVEVAVESTSDEFIGLHFGEFQNLSAHGLMLQIMQSSKNIKEALQYVCQFTNLGCSAMPMALKESKDFLDITFTPDPFWIKQSPQTARQTADGLIAFTIREIKNLLRQQPLEKLTVKYGFPKPKNCLELERVFDANVQFGCEETAIIVGKKDAEKQVVTNDKELLEVLVGYAWKKLHELESKIRFSDKVKKTVLNMLKPDFPAVEEVAGNMNLSVRTLQRKLQEEGNTYKQLVEDLKYEIALSYLNKKDLSINAISYNLNYSDPSSFTRLFKKRSGITPLEYRQRLS